MNPIKMILQNIVGLGLGKYVNLGLLLAAVVAGIWAYTNARIVATEASFLRSQVAALELKSKADELVISKLRENFDKQTKIMNDVYQSALDSKIEEDRAKELLNEFTESIEKLDGDTNAIESKLNQWQSDMDECLEEASGGPAARPENKIC